jgi:hypothetical protein
LECLCEHAEGDHHVLAGGEAVMFERAHDLAFPRLVCM